jgi:hypothetical protein
VETPEGEERAVRSARPIVKGKTAFASAARPTTRSPAIIAVDKDGNSLGTQVQVPTKRGNFSTAIEHSLNKSQSLHRSAVADRRSSTGPRQLRPAGTGVDAAQRQQRRARVRASSASRRSTKSASRSIATTASDFVDRQVVYQEGLDHEPLDSVSADDVHVGTGRQR